MKPQEKICVALAVTDSYICGMNFWIIFYNSIVVPLLWILFRLGGLLNKKIRRGINGRKNLLQRLQNDVQKLSAHNRIWFHASSLGEFEQAKPIIAAIKQRYPNTDIIATFFSPSGYEHSKNYKLANIISYIPFDSHSQAKQFVEIVRPTLAVMVRYDIWPNMIWSLRRNNIPVMIANATMRGNSLRKLPVLKQFHRSLYNCFSHILTVSEHDRQSFSEFNTTKPVIAAIGDTRFDQVMMRSRDARTKQIFAEKIIQGKKIFIVGQSWQEDEEVILPVLFKLNEQEPELLTIIVPHEPTLEHLEQLEMKLENNISFIRFSEMNQYTNEQCILVDSVGVLVALYKYAHVVYIGGSFWQGIHNVLEPAVFGVPVVYGPKHTNSQEAVQLAALHGGFIVEDEKELYRTLRTLLDNETQRTTAAEISRSFVETNCGATEKFLAFITGYIQ